MFDMVLLPALAKSFVIEEQEGGEEDEDEDEDEDGEE